jgi:hypothetical protein
MAVVRQRPRTNLIAALVGLPYLAALGAVFLGFVRLPPVGPAWASPAEPGGRMLLLLGGVFVLAWSVSARDRTTRFVAYTVYALALALGFGYGTALAFLNVVGGMDGTERGPLWLTVFFAAGVVVCVVSIFAVLAMVLREIKDAG